MGRQFHIPEGELESFEKEHDDEERLAKVVYWLERHGTLEWENIYRVLEMRSVGESKLASDLRRESRVLLPGILKLSIPSIIKGLLREGWVVIDRLQGCYCHWA